MSRVMIVIIIIWFLIESMDYVNEHSGKAVVKFIKYIENKICTFLVRDKKQLTFEDCVIFYLVNSHKYTYKQLHWYWSPTGNSVRV